MRPTGGGNMTEHGVVPTSELCPEIGRQVSSEQETSCYVRLVSEFRVWCLVHDTVHVYGAGVLTKLVPDNPQ